MLSLLGKVCCRPAATVAELRRQSVVQHGGLALTSAPHQSPVCLVGL